MRDTTITELHVDQLEPHPDNPRKNLGDLTELIESIKKNGIFQNLTVVPVWDDEEENRYRIVIGHRRFAAAKAAGIDTLPCRIEEDMDEKTQFSTMLEENIQRSDLTVIEQAEGFQMMLDLGNSVGDICKRTGFSETTVRSRLNIAKLDKGMVEKWTDGSRGYQMTIKDFKALEQIPDIGERNRILEEADDQFDIMNEVEGYLKEQNMKSNEALYIAKLENMGVRKAPDGTNPWGIQWDKIAQLSLRTDDEEIDLGGNDPGGLLYVRQYSTIFIIKAAAEEEEEPEEKPEEKKGKFEEAIRKRKMMMRQHDELVKLCHGMDERRRDFITRYVKGKLPVPDYGSAGDRMGRLLDLMINCEITSFEQFPLWYITDLLTGKNADNAEPEDYERAKEELEDMSPEAKLLLLTEALISDSDALLLEDWAECKYIEEGGEILKEYYAILKSFGMKPDSTTEALIDGTHALYEKEENNEDETGN